DIEIQAREVLWIKRRIYDILAYHSGKEVGQLERDADRDYWLSASEAKDYGLIDNVLELKRGFKPELGEDKIKKSEG
ncbi:MAG TPA: ATP-dependent Clp protease proteolytic subunit, partial [Rhodothermales bacterium]